MNITIDKLKHFLVGIIMLLSLNSYAQYSQGLVNMGIPADKQQHFMAGGFSSIWGYGITYGNTKDRRKAKFWGIVTPIVIGTLKEVSDIKTTGFDVKDLGATVLGGVVVTYTFDFLVGRKLHREKRLKE